MADLLQAGKHVGARQALAASLQLRHQARQALLAGAQLAHGPLRCLPRQRLRARAFA